jgi:S-adenosylhomocysteine hydrolase
VYRDQLAGTLLADAGADLGCATGYPSFVMSTTSFTGGHLSRIIIGIKTVSTGKIEALLAFL